MALLLSRIIKSSAGILCIVLILSSQLLAATSTPYKILTNKKNIIVWQEVGPWLIITEDLTAGRICYYYDPVRRTQLNLKEALPGNWIPLGSAIKWLMYVDHYQGLDRLMSHDVDWHAYYISRPSSQNQVGCGMVDTRCIYGQYRAAKVGDHYPVDLYDLSVQTGACAPFCISDSEKSQFAHDGNLLVYRAYYGPGNARIYGHYFNGSVEFEIAARNGIEPSVCGSIVAWAEAKDIGYDIVAKNISTGEMRTLAYTTADPPSPEAGRGAIFWRDSRNAAASGIDIYGYDWEAQQEFVVTNAAGEQSKLRVCDDLVTWVTGLTNYQTLWGANVLTPVKITDLRASLVTSNSVELTWTSAGSAANPPVAYDLRMSSDAPITESNWAQSTPITGLPTPKSPGQVETFIVQSLSVGHHYFALKARLQNGDYSLISNGVCAYVSNAREILNANAGADISFTGTITGIGFDGAAYCEDTVSMRAIRVVPISGQSIVIGQAVTVTGKLNEDADYYGPVLQQALINPAAQAVQVQVKPLAMANKWLGGRDIRFGGTSQNGLSNQWMLVKSWGKVSGFTGGSGCSFYINDGSILTDNDGCGVYVNSRFAAPAGLVNGSYVSVEGISCVSRTSGRRIEVVQDGKTKISSP